MTELTAKLGHDDDEDARAQTMMTESVNGDVKGPSQPLNRS
jgi:hypothetical protein